MRTVNIHEAKTQLSKLVDKAVQGEGFIIAKAGKPLVKVVPVDAPDAPRPRVGFLKGLKAPADFDTLGAAAIADLFHRG